MVMTIQRIQTGDTTSLDGSDFKDYAPLLISKASNLCTYVVIPASFSKLELILCIPPVLVVVVVAVGYLVSILTGSHSNVFSATFKKYPCIIGGFTCECAVAEGLDHYLS